MHFPALVGAVALSAGLLVNAALAGDEKPADAKHGKSLFAEHCAVCHGASAEGGMGPALKDETKRKKPEQIRAQIIDPQPPMAKLYPKPLSDKDVDDLVAYVVTL
jgi:cytochrome c oxidase cbb3-type subunit 3